MTCRDELFPRLRNLFQQLRRHTLNRDAVHRDRGFVNVNAITGDRDDSRIREAFAILLHSKAHDVASNVSDTLCVGHLGQDHRREDDQ
jgi:hypothetical protein